MSARLVRRIEKLEVAVERERAGTIRWRLFWISPVTGDRIDCMSEGTGGQVAHAQGACILAADERRMAGGGHPGK